MSTDAIGEVAKYAGVAGVAVLVIGMVVLGLARSSAFTALRPWQSFVVVLLVIVVVAMIAMTALFGSMPELAAMLRESGAAPAQSSDAKSGLEVDAKGPPGTDASVSAKGSSQNLEATPPPPKPEVKGPATPRRQPTQDIAQALSPICPEELGKRAERGGIQSLVEFRNHTDEPLTLHWIDYAGLRKQYATVEPRDTRSIYSYAGHPWVVSDSEGKCFDFFVADGLLMQRDLRR